jgi:hypothetical protein
VLRTAGDVELIVRDINAHKPSPALP